MFSVQACWKRAGILFAQRFMAFITQPPSFISAFVFVLSAADKINKPPEMQTAVKVLLSHLQAGVINYTTSVGTFCAQIFICIDLDRARVNQQL